MSDRREIEGALDRRVPDHERLRAAWEKMDDWKGTCRHCGEKLTGTLSALRAHKCEPPK